jgi:hypothetical protein
VINPYYNPNDLGLKMLSFDQDGLSYEFNTICFWKNDKNKVFFAKDSGCSCPIPFEDYAGETREDVESKLQAVNLKQALTEFSTWNKSYNGFYCDSFSADSKIRAFFKKSYNE